MRVIEDGGQTMVVTSYADMPEGYENVARTLERAWEDLLEHGGVRAEYTHIELRAVEHKGSDEPFVLLGLPEEERFIGLLAVTDEAEEILAKSGLLPSEWLVREEFYEIMALYVRRNDAAPTGWEAYHPTLGVSGTEYKRIMAGSRYDN